MKRSITRVLRLLVDALPPQGGQVKLDALRSHHLGTVLRAELGQALLLMDGHGRVAKAVLEAGGRHCLLACEAPAPQAPPPLPLQAWMPVIRPERLEMALEKLTELGVAQVCLYTSDHSGNLRRPVDMARLRRVCEAAVEQSGNPWLPQLESALQLEERLAQAHPPLVLATPSGEALETLPDAWGGLALVVGPEGGFSPMEQERLLERAVARVALGPHILRAETAMVLLAGVLHARAIGPGFNQNTRVAFPGRPSTGEGIPWT